MFKKMLASWTDGNASFLRAARAGNLEKVLDYLKGSTDINTSNANGLNALHLASKEGHVNVVTELLKRGANVDAATKKGNTALHIASLAGQEEIVKILVQHGAAVNVQSQNGFTPLYMAAQENHSDVVKFLLANGANQSLATEDGFTPLAVALQQGHDKVVTVLLENDSRGKVRLPALHIAAKKDDCKAAALLLQNDHNPDVTSKSGFTPLHIAAHYGNENIAVLLLERAADVNFAARHNITPLHVAAKWGKANMVTLLLDKGAEIDAKTRDGLTALHCAARSGHDNVVDLLLEKGAPIVAKTKNGLAPLHMASQGDHVDSARILLYHKAPVDDVTVDYLTALHVAAHCGHVRVAKLLLDRKADANSRALNGFTPLHIACKKNRIKVVELLLKHGASIEATTESGLTPLHVASFMGCMNIVIYLIQHGASPDVPTIRGETPLHLAARANQTDIIRILLRNGAHVDARAREQQTPLHIASRLGNTDIVVLLLQHGASVDAVTKDLYTPLHIAAKEGQEEVASILLEHGASLTATTQKGFTPLHLAAKYGNMKVARLLLQRDAPVDAQGKNGLTPLHVAAHYDHVNVALLLLDKGASPHAAAKNGYTPLHIAAKKNQMDIATTLLEYGAKPNAESKAGFTPLHLSSQEGHTDMASLLIEHHGDVNAKAKNGLTPLHLCAQEERVNVAAILVKNGAEIDPCTKAGYTPLHVACHFGQINMIRFLLQHNANVNAVTALGYTPLHQAAQQGHTLIINLLLQHKASPNAVTNQGQTPLSIAQRLGYISVVETLKVVTETIVTTTTTTIIEEKYKVVSPETMQEVFISDSEDEGAGEETLLGDMSFRYLSTDDRDMHDDSADMQDSRDMSFGEGKLLHDSLEGKDFFGRNAKDERIEASIHQPSYAAYQNTVHHGTINPKPQEYVGTFTGNYIPDNVDISRQPVYAGFLVSFMVDARGGAMRGCRHSGVRVIIPPRKAPMPMRITCRYLKKEKLLHPPPLMEGEALASRVLEMGPSGAKFLGPVIIEIPHFASLRGKEREIMILRSDNGESWREHTLEASEEAVQEVLNESFDGDELSAIEDLNTTRITRILTTDFPQYFAIVTRIRQEVHAIGPEGGMVSSTVVPQVQAVFPEGALTKKIKVGLQAQPIPSELVAKMLGNRVAVSPIVTVEPRRRKFHKPITLTIPVPQAASKGMINQYSGEAPTLRLLCSITGGTTPAQWEDITGTTPLTFVNDCVSFTTTVSARFWLMDCRQVNEAAKFASDLYREAIMVPFMAKFVVFAKRHDMHEAKLRAFCMTDDKEDKTLENQEHFIEVAKSRDVEVLDSKPQYVEFAGNLIPVTKSGEQLHLNFHPFHENRLPFIVRVKDPHQDAIGRIAFMREPKVGRGEPPQTPLCNLTIKLPGDIQAEQPISEPDLVTLEKRYTYIKEMGIGKPETITKANLRLTDIANQLENDWVILALQLDITESEINKIKSDNPEDDSEQALAMLRLWLQKAGPKATGNNLEKSLRKINREDIVKKCMFNVELVTDEMDRAIDMVAMDQSGFEAFKEELGPSRDASLRRDTSLDVSYDEGDMSKDGEFGGIDHVFIKEQPSVKSREKEDVLVKEKIIPSRTEEVDYEKTRTTIEEKIVRTITKEIDYEILPEKDLDEQKFVEKKVPKAEPVEIVPTIKEILKEKIPSPEKIENKIDITKKIGFESPIPLLVEKTTKGKDEIKEYTEIISEKFKDEITGKFDKEIPVKTPKEIPIKSLKEIPFKTPEEIPVKISKESPVKITEEIPIKISQEISVKCPEEIPIKTPKEFPEIIPKQFPEIIPKEFPEKISKEISTKIEKIVESKIEGIFEPDKRKEKIKVHEVVVEDTIIPEIRRTEIITTTTVKKIGSPEDQSKKIEIMRQIGAEIAELESAYETQKPHPLISHKAEEKIEEEIPAVEEPVIVPALAKSKELVTEEIIVTRTPGLEDRIQEKHMPRKTKTPPPTPVDKEMKEYGEIYDATKPLVITQRSETTEIDQDGTVRKSITTITTETTAKSFMQDDEVFPEQLKSHVAAKLAESETFQSEDMDASIEGEPYFVQEKGSESSLGEIINKKQKNPSQSTLHENFSEGGEMAGNNRKYQQNHSSLPIDVTSDSNLDPGMEIKTRPVIISPSLEKKWSSKKEKKKRCPSPIDVTTYENGNEYDNTVPIIIEPEEGQKSASNNNRRHSSPECRLTLDKDRTSYGFDKGQEYKVDASRPSIDEEGEVEVDITEHDDLRGVTEPTDFMEPYERQVQIVKDEISGAPHMTSGASGVVTRTVTSTIRDGDQVTTTVTETTEGGEHDQQLQQSMREIIDQFMADPQTQQYYQQYTYEDQDEE